MSGWRCETRPARACAQLPAMSRCSSRCYPAMCRGRFLRVADPGCGRGDAAHTRCFRWPPSCRLDDPTPSCHEASMTGRAIPRPTTGLPMRGLWASGSLAPGPRAPTQSQTMTAYRPGRTRRAQAPWQEQEPRPVRLAACTLASRCSDVAARRPVPPRGLVIMQLGATVLGRTLRLTA